MALHHQYIYHKSTDRNTFLRADSFHPKGLKNSIAFEQLQCLRRISDEESDFEKQAQEMFF